MFLKPITKHEENQCHVYSQCPHIASKNKLNQHLIKKGDNVWYVWLYIKPIVIKMKYDTFNDTAGEKSYIQNIFNFCIKISHILNLSRSKFRKLF